MTRTRSSCVAGAAVLGATLLFACPPSPGPRAASGALGDASTARDATSDATSDATRELPVPVASEDGFATARAAEIDRRLSLPMNLFLAHEQTRPRGFVDFRGRRTAPKSVHSARMFANGYAGSCAEIVEKDGTICSGALYPGASMTPEQTTRAAEILRRAPATWSSRSLTMCFEPHHAVVFFDERGVPIADLSVCFECGNFKLSPGPQSEADMTDDEGMFLADTCRALDVGGCPPAGRYRMPEVAFHDDDLPYDERYARRRRELLARPHGVEAERLLVDLKATQQNVLCAWFTAGTVVVPHGLECSDGRVMDVQEDSECAKPASKCRATVSDFVTCARARLGNLCGVDPPECAKSDECGRGVVLRKRRR